jgi:hypothetical protein
VVVVLEVVELPPRLRDDAAMTDVGCEGIIKAATPTMGTSRTTANFIIIEHCRIKNDDVRREFFPPAG